MLTFVSHMMSNFLDEYFDMVVQVNLTVMLVIATLWVIFNNNSLTYTIHSVTWASTNRFPARLMSRWSTLGWFSPCSVPSLKSCWSGWKISSRGMLWLHRVSSSKNSYQSHYKYWLMILVVPHFSGVDVGTTETRWFLRFRFILKTLTIKIDLIVVFGNGLTDFSPSHHYCSSQPTVSSESCSPLYSHNTNKMNNAKCTWLYLTVHIVNWNICVFCDVYFLC